MAMDVIDMGNLVGEMVRTGGLIGDKLVVVVRMAEDS